jgi:hypothetical protein
MNKIAVNIFIAIIGIFVLITVTCASAAEINDKWLQITYKAKGYEVNYSTGDYFPTTYNLTAYVHLYWNDTYYQAFMYSYHNTGWAYEFAHWESTGTVDEDYIPFSPIIIADYGTLLTSTFTAKMKFKKDSSGAVTGASFADSGCYVTASTLPTVNHQFNGSCKIKAKTIDPSKLPFTP